MTTDPLHVSAHLLRYVALLHASWHVHEPNKGGWWGAVWKSLKLCSAMGTDVQAGAGIRSFPQVSSIHLRCLMQRDAASETRSCRVEIKAQGRRGQSLSSVTEIWS
ncbi:hypothetical protein MUK42_34036 [Musa troglodytarum]|uniref:Uncharacterized protein n=1 Tax=Musa troglodytarum TaxID=320322 RepID=A0A9E7EHH8_9LILI|nr:hypothetical protein MUK42_34036 [Musa troglodytarum]